MARKPIQGNTCCFHLQGRCRFGSGCKFPHRSVGPCSFGASCKRHWPGEAQAQNQKPGLQLPTAAAAASYPGSAPVVRNRSIVCASCSMRVSHDGSNEATFKASCPNCNVELDIMGASSKLAGERGRNASTVKMPVPGGNACIVCYGDDDEMFLGNPQRCQHPRNFCRSCFDRHVQVALKTNTAHILKCPGCQGKDSRSGKTTGPVLLEVSDVQRISSATVFNTYSEQLTRRMLMGDNMSFLNCSNPSCKSIVEVLDGETSPLQHCQSCAWKTCFKCKVTWHHGLTCEENESKHADSEVQTTLYMEENTRKCPQCQCGPCFKETADCDIATCPSCEFRFCWECQCDYERVLATDCKAHSPICKHHQ